MAKPGSFQVALEAVIEKDGQILLTRRSFDRDHAPGEWETLTTRVESAKTFEQALKREVKEEVGLEVEIVRPFHTFHFYRGPAKIEHLGVSFWCRYQGGQVALNPREQISYQWVSPEEALSIVSDESILRAINKFREIFDKQFG